MSSETLLIGLLVALALYATFVLALIVAGRRSDARALAGFIPDCLVLFKRMLADQRVSRARKLAVLLLLLYLALPLDLIPDFIPVAGQLDDAILVAIVLRLILHGGNPDLLEEHWPGPPQGRALIQRLTFGRSGEASAGAG
jgi:uncharacterized membrane protein YkvA (DUF1232 family)